MSTCLRHVKAIVCNRFFFTNFTFVCNEEGRVKEKLTEQLILLCMANMMVKMLTPYINPLVSYKRICKRFEFIFPILAVQLIVLLLLLCRAVTPKVIGL